MARNARLVKESLALVAYHGDPIPASFFPESTEYLEKPLASYPKMTPHPYARPRPERSWPGLAISTASGRL